MRLFFVVEDLVAARSFYDLLLDQTATCGPDRLSYQVDGVKLDFYRLTPEQALEYQLSVPVAVGGGVCLARPNWPDHFAHLEAAGARWIRNWGPAPWGGSMAHLTDPFGFRWELMQETL